MTEPTAETTPLAALARIRQMTDAWEQRLPETIRTPAVVSALRAVLDRAAPAAPLPPAGQPALRDRIAAALYAHDHPHHTVALDETGMGPAYRESADAVLAVLPAAPGRAEYDALVAEADRLRRDGTALAALAVAADEQVAVLRQQVAAPADQTALRETLRRVLAEADEFSYEDLEPHDYQKHVDGVLAAVLPATTRHDTDTGKFARVERLALTFEVSGNEFIAEQIRAALADETAATETQEVENPARIDRLRPEFFEHASVEAIDAHIQRARRQQRNWGNRERTLATLRQNRVEQKERGEWPAGARQDEAQLGGAE
ncbi:hypothetical protein KVH31_34940 [Streptomyces olivaceus]|uniref:hypothetical protein n=1 Tax=Streptomyces olivaceus TaxID=47716 RepID=UPI001CC97D5D|nr:hypothetical protein [Streptomyces olivaceus]MBZ6211695.1 hypothetical protein [Streptomyces olivaceus]